MEIPITIGRATLSDLEEIVAIEESCLSSEEIVSYEFLEESIRKIAGTFLVAGDENQLLGYVLGEAQSISKIRSKSENLACLIFIFPPDKRDLPISDTIQNHCNNDYRSLLLQQSHSFQNMIVVHQDSAKEYLGDLVRLSPVSRPQEEEFPVPVPNGQDE